MSLLEKTDTHHLPIEWKERLSQNRFWGNAWIISGLEKTRIYQSAIELASLVLEEKKTSLSIENHPDCHFYRIKGKAGLHSIESIKEMCELVYLAPQQSRYQVFIVEHADRMLPDSANALLKTIEEPAPHSLILLLTQNISQILETIASRCRKWHCKNRSSSEIAMRLVQEKQLCQEKADFIAYQAMGSYEKAVMLTDTAAEELSRSVFDILKNQDIQTHLDESHYQVQIDSYYAILKQEEENLKKNASYLSYGGDLKEALEKEIQGKIAILSEELLHHILELVYGWFEEVWGLKEENSILFQHYPEELTRQKDSNSSLSDLNKLWELMEETALAAHRHIRFEILIEHFWKKLLRQNFFKRQAEQSAHGH